MTIEVDRNYFDNLVTTSNKTKALIKFIAKNWHHCPIDENWDVKDCACWGSDKCKDCLLENICHIKD